MFDVTRFKYLGISAVILVLAAGLSGCTEVIHTTPSSPIAKVTAETLPSAPQAIAAAIYPPDILLQGGKDHFNKRLPEIAAQPILDGGILLAGDSITEAWLWHQDYLPLPSSNHGIGWDIAEGLKLRLPLILQHNPDHLFIMIGTNDIGYGHGTIDVVPHVDAFIEIVKQEKPSAKIYLQAILPRDAASMPRVRAFNSTYKSLSMKHGVKFIDMTAEFEAADGTLNPDFTEDGLHLNAAGYALWGRLMKENL